MKGQEMNLMEWQQHYGTEAACVQAVAQQRWTEGFVVRACGHDHGYAITTRHCWEYSRWPCSDIVDSRNVVSFYQSAAKQIGLG